jgi:general secretion pathway protein B
MSYILKALKKLEEKRRSETGPYFLSTTSSGKSSGRQDRKRNFPWRYLIVFGLFLNLGIILWLFHPWRSEKPLETGAWNVPRKTRVLRPHDTGGERPESGSRQLQPVTKTEEGPSAGYEDNVLTASSEAPRLPSGDTLRNTKIIGMQELPLSVRQRLPDLSISGHFYDSRPSIRVVTVGGRILHEGAAIAPGVTLERITPDGAVFSCDGIRFRKGVF